MAYFPCILVATAATAPDIEKVIEAQGRGPNSLTNARRLVAIGTTSPVVAYMTQDMTATPVLEAAWRAYADSGDLPDISPNVWGENGIISSTAAQTASAGLTVHSVAGQVPDDWAEAVIASHGLEFEPGPEI